MDARTAQFEGQRERLFALAYRMLGSRSAAEDVVQDTWLRWNDTDTDALEVPEAWLVTVATRLALDQLRRRRRERDRYIGPWLPDPLPPAPEQPEHGMERAESVSMAFLLLLERLPPRPRASFLLREVFDYAYPDIATMLEQSEAACRQQVHRARALLRREAPEPAAPPVVQAHLLQRFAEALQHPSPERLRALFTEDAVHVSDGGGRVRAALHPLRGADRLARLYMQIVRQIPAGQVRDTVSELNGQPVLLRHIAGRLDTVMWIQAEGDRIAAMYVQRNPDKLRGLVTTAPRTASPR